MLQLPPIPAWDSMHPLIVHFPIVLLLISPIFVAISAVPAPPKGRPYMVAAMLTILLGTISAYFATATGEAAAELADRAGAINAVLESHESLAEATKIIFSVLTLILFGMYLVPLMLRRQETRLFSTFLPLAFLALYSVGILFLVNTAHAGGRLVHEFGVHAILPASETSVTRVEAAESRAKKFNPD
jgi:uncharacterized membrane protein